MFRATCYTRLTCKGSLGLVILNSIILNSAPSFAILHLAILNYSRYPHTRCGGIIAPLREEE